MKKRIAVLLSGRGTNLEALHRNAEHFEIVLVASNRDNPIGIQKAHSLGIPTKTFPRDRFDSTSSQKSALYRCVLDIAPDFVVLAGYLQIVEKELLTQFPDRLLNIHPSLLPHFAGLHGDNLHREVLLSGAKEHGCTVHLVDSGVDTGTRISQAKVSVDVNDTPESLANKVLTIEHLLYPWTMNQICCGEITIHSGQITYSEATLERSRELGIITFTERLNGDS